MPARAPFCIDNPLTRKSQVESFMLVFFFQPKTPTSASPSPPTMQENSDSSSGKSSEGGAADLEGAIPNLVHCSTASPSKIGLESPSKVTLAPRRISYLPLFSPLPFFFVHGFLSAMFFYYPFLLIFVLFLKFFLFFSLLFFLFPFM